jgi:two-component system OmpR family sensor kinase
MSEPQEQTEDKKSPGQRPEHSLPLSSHLEGSLAGERQLGALFDSHSPKSEFPGWLGPFFSLRMQLTLVYGMVLALVVVVICLLTYQRVTPPYVVIPAAIMTVVGGALIAFVFTSLLLRPLSRVTDAAQAIAIGDLQQRKRLPLRLPPQDEVDRLAGSLHEMVTRLERAEEMQRVAESRFQRFFADASHQLRTPLTSIRGFTEVLLRGAKDDPETAQRILSRMKGEVERMTRLINDILTLARLDDGRPLKTQYLDLLQMASDGVAQAKNRLNDERKISLVVETQGTVGLQADKDRIKQLLFILLDNAVKHGRPAPDGEITLYLGKTDKQALIRVIDNGEIEKEDLEHIFDAFYKGHHKYSVASNGATVGAGLGLTVASAIVRAHHGSITVCSDPDVGTEFRVMLPCVD